MSLCVYVHMCVCTQLCVYARVCVCVHVCCWLSINHCGGPPSSSGHTNQAGPDGLYAFSNSFSLHNSSGWSVYVWLKVLSNVFFMYARCCGLARLGSKTLYLKFQNVFLGVILNMPQKWCVFYVSERGLTMPSGKSPEPLKLPLW